jgi:hypothetical protein
VVKMLEEVVESLRRLDIGLGMLEAFDRRRRTT